VKLRKSGNIILTVLAILIVFSALTIWHDRTPGKSDRDDVFTTMAGLTERAPELSGLFAQFDMGSPNPFYLVGIQNGDSWPTEVMKACYRDPLASRFQFKRSSSEFEGGLSAFRYRSPQDMVRLLHESELETPGYLASLDVKSWVVIPVSPGDASMKFLVGVILIISSIIISTRIKS